MERALHVCDEKKLQKHVREKIYTGFQMHPLTDKPVAGIYIVSVMSISYRKKALSAGQDVSSQWAFLICDCFVGM